MVEFVQLELTDIIADKRTQLRRQMDVDVIIEYAEAIKRGDTFPPIIVYRDDAGVILSEGWHRFEASKEAGEPNMLCEVHQPEEGMSALRSAMFHAAGANATHGMRRTNEDKRKAILMFLEDEEWQGKSSRWIAEAAKVDHKTVEALREEVGKSSPEANPQERLGKDQKVRQKSEPKKKRGRPRKSQKEENEEAGQISALSGDQPPKPDPVMMDAKMLVPEPMVERMRILSRVCKTLPDPVATLGQAIKEGAGYFTAEWADYLSNWAKAYADAVREHEAAPSIDAPAEDTMPDVGNPTSEDSGVPEVVVEDASGTL